MAMFKPNFGAARLMPPIPIPGFLTGSGPVKLSSAAICLEGDEKKVKMPASYTSGSHTTPGLCLLTIESLEENHLSKKTKYKDKKILLKGGNFKAKLQVLLPAMIPGTPPIPDLTFQYHGEGSFTSLNFTIKAT